MKKRNQKLLYRPVVVFFCMLICIGLIPVRLFYINTDYKRVGSVENSKTITLSESRGMIYDRNLNPLVCDVENTVSVIKPTVNAVAALKGFIDSDRINVLLEEISKSNPVLLNIGNVIDCEDIITVPIYKRYNSMSLAKHIIGYLDEGDENGICGIEKSFNSYLNNYCGELKARFFVDANGGLLHGSDFQIINNNYVNSSGVVLTLDKDMQQAVESVLDNSEIKKGAAVMLEVNTGRIIAITSRPDFDREKIEEAVSDENLPLFNRALGSYPVGSVFKPLIAAAALECGIDPSEEYLCNGFVKIGSNVFNCTSSHGRVNMPSAVAYSCNCYFVNLIRRIDIHKAVDIASVLGFGNQLSLAEGIKSYGGNLPDVNELDSLSSKALFSFGQGSLSANIIQIASLYAAIANNGNCYMPYLVEGTVDNEKNFVSKYEQKPPYKVFSEKSADLLSSFLELAVREGTGKRAIVDSVRVCGKTATAQTGEFIHGKEKLITWFAGFFPYEKPEYVLVVMCENGTLGAEDCAPVFSKIITKILYNK